MKKFWKVVGWVVLAIAGLVVWMSSDERQTMAYGYMLIVGVGVWAIIDHINTKIAFLRVEIAELERRLNKLADQEELRDMKFYTMPAARDRA